MLNHPSWKPIFSTPFYKKDLKDYGESWFANLWREKGKKIFHTYFIKE
jgi:hypothetical protein